MNTKTQSVPQTPRASDPHAVVDGEHIRYVRVKAHSARANDDGTYTIEFPARALTPAEDDMLATLFPHCESEVREMLDKEALIAALVRS